MTTILAAISVVFWASGYLASRGIIAIQESSAYWTAYIVVPKWLYILCGAPVSKSRPMSSVMARILGIQFMGITLGIFTLIDSFFQLSRDGFLLGLGISVSFPYLIVYYFSRANKQFK